MTFKEFIKLWEKTDSLTTKQLSTLYQNCIANIDMLEGSFKTDWNKDEIPFLKQTMESIEVILHDLKNGTLKPVYDFIDTKFRVTGTYDDWKGVL